MAEAEALAVLQPIALEVLKEEALEMLPEAVEAVAL
jgi:hypothetical protein